MEHNNKNIISPSNVYVIRCLQEPRKIFNHLTFLELAKIKMLRFFRNYDLFVVIILIIFIQRESNGDLVSEISGIFTGHPIYK